MGTTLVQQQPNQRSMNLKTIIKLLPTLSPTDHDLIERAYAFAEHAHDGQTRRSGEAYFTHPIRVATILAEMRLDAPTIAAALLHDVVEDCDGISIENIEKEFDAEVALLVHGVTKMEQLPTKSDNHNPQKRSSYKEVEFLRQIFMAMGNDVRVILVKLADRLDNMRTLASLSSESQIRNARETMDIYAPLANRLGIGQMKWQLEDLSFRYLSPDRYKEIATQLAERRQNRELDLTSIINRIKKTLVSEGINAQVSGRPKHIYSIHRKMDRKQLPFDQIFDVRAVRVMVDDVPTCYRVLGLVHSLWRPINGEFDDYIAAAKDNGYRSLHTAIIDDDGKTLEVQIRTFEMHQDSEYGIAAHWKYKELDRKTDEKFEQRISYMRRLLENAHEDEDNPEEFVEVIRQSIAGDRIYVFTPQNDIIDMPEGATPVDFAYHIHTEVGHRCRGAKVDGKMVGLDYELKTGQHVEIITANRGGPSLDWLNENLGYVKTTRAAQKIRQWLRKQDRHKNISTGRDALDRELKRLGMEEYPRADIANTLDYPSVDHMLAAIGYGDTNATSIVGRMVQIEQRQQVAERDELILTKPSEVSNTPDQGIDIMGTGGLLVKRAVCCNPAPGDPIVGFITRSSGVTVHRSDCKNVLNSTEPERLISVSWGRPESQIYTVPIEIRARDRKGLLRDIGAVIAGENINMINVNITTSDNQVAVFSLEMEVSHISQLSRVLSKIEMVPEVIHVRRRTAS